MKCLECHRDAVDRIVLWNEELDAYEDCDVRCGVHARKYTRLGFHRCGLRPIIIKLRLTSSWM